LQGLSPLPISKITEQQPPHRNQRNRQGKCKWRVAEAAGKLLKAGKRDPQAVAAKADKPRKAVKQDLRAAVAEEADKQEELLFALRRLNWTPLKISYF
jgi:hypothetical protein